MAPAGTELRPRPGFVERLLPGHGPEEAWKRRHAVRTVVAVKAVLRPVATTGRGVKGPSLQRFGDRHVGRHLRILRRAGPVRLAIDRVPRHRHEPGLQECVGLVVRPAEYRHGHGSHPVDWPALGREDGPVLECGKRDHGRRWLGLLSQLWVPGGGWLIGSVEVRVVARCTWNATAIGWVDIPPICQYRVGDVFADRVEASGIGVQANAEENSRGQSS